MFYKGKTTWIAEQRPPSSDMERVWSQLRNLVKSSMSISTSRQAQLVFELFKFRHAKDVGARAVWRANQDNCSPRHTGFKLHVGTRAAMCLVSRSVRCARCEFSMYVCYLCVRWLCNIFATRSIRVWELCALNVWYVCYMYKSIRVYAISMTCVY